TNFQGYGLVRSTAIGRHAVYGSSFEFRLPLSSFAHGRSGSSPGLRPPSRSMSAIVPPPTHGPVRSMGPSGNRGTGWLLSSASLSTGVPGLMNSTPPFDSLPVGDGMPLATSAPGSL